MDAACTCVYVVVAASAAILLRVCVGVRPSLIRLVVVLLACVEHWTLVKHKETENDANDCNSDDRNNRRYNPHGFTRLHDIDARVNVNLLASVEVQRICFPAVPTVVERCNILVTECFSVCNALQNGWV